MPPASWSFALVERPLADNRIVPRVLGASAGADESLAPASVETTDEMERGLDPLKILRRGQIAIEGDLPGEMKEIGWAEVVDPTRHGFVVEKIDRVPDARVVVGWAPA